MKKAGFVLSLMLLLATGSANGSDYKIDKTHSSIGFAVKHMVISNVKGQFNDFSGSFSFDEKSKTLSAAKLNIDAASIYTNDKKRDAHLKSKEFFSAAKFPTITFTLTSFKNIGNGEIEGTGELTIKNVTKKIKLKGEYIGSANDPWGNRRAGFSATAYINRKEFGITYNKLLETGGLLIAEKVKLMIEVEGILQKPSGKK